MSDNVEKFYTARNRAAYWQERCIINENVLDTVIDVIGTALPSTQEPLTDLCEQWTEALDTLENKFGIDEEMSMRQFFESLENQDDLKSGIYDE